jgi:thiamine pyrophosphate-dependent acetolactate synthase large subunit-like protein
MNCQELATAFIEKMNLKVLLLNNQHLGMVVQWEDRFYKVRGLARRERRGEIWRQGVWGSAC